jgi:HPt (histidine-containing phosphotransfer) domain-containing protein
MTPESESSAKECANIVIDWGVLGTLEAYRGPEDPDPRIKLITLYLKFSSELVELVKKAIRASDGPSLASAAHSLKSSSLSMGAKKLGALCRELELVGRAGVPREAADLLNRIEEYHIELTKALKEALQRLMK